jgi:hypothetical protein
VPLVTAGSVEVQIERTTFSFLPIVMNLKVFYFPYRKEKTSFRTYLTKVITLQPAGDSGKTQNYSSLSYLLRKFTASSYL